MKDENFKDLATISLTKQEQAILWDALHEARKRIATEAYNEKTEAIDELRSLLDAASHAGEVSGCCLFVNTYEINSQYGGPEEGGWYYNDISLVAFVPVYSPSDVVDEIVKEAYQMADGSDRDTLTAMLEDKWKYLRECAAKSTDYKDDFYLTHMFTGAGGSNLMCKVERCPGASVTVRKPHYE